MREVPSESEAEGVKPDSGICGQKLPQSALRAAGSLGEGANKIRAAVGSFAKAKVATGRSNSYESAVRWVNR